ncbi:MAG: restriction endonuclease subunit S [Thiolinea sp.]
MSERRNVTLGEEIDFLTGFPFESGSYSDGEGDIKLLRGDNIAQGFLRWDDVKKWPASQKSNYKQFELQEGDVVLAMDRPWIEAGLKYASVSMHDLPCLLVQRTARMRGGKNLDTVYLKYIIGSPWFSKYIQKITTGSLVPHISGSQIKDFPLKLQRLGEQKKIVRVLSSIDQKIEINNRINAELEAMAKTLYDYWFVQFDFPFDFAQGTPDVNGKPYKSSGGKMVYNEELKREIPAGWMIQPIAKWIASDKSGDWGQETLQGNYNKRVTCIRGTDINGLKGKSKLSPPIRYILSKNEQKLLESHDLIIEISGGSPSQSTGRLAYITEETLRRFNDSLICSNFCKAISLKNKHTFFTFIYLWSQLYDSGAFFGWEGKTSGIKNLLFEAFANSHEVEMPPDDLHQVFYKVLRPVEAKKQKVLLENQHLSELRDWLLPMLMNGQVQVTETNDTKAAETQY